MIRHATDFRIKHPVGSSAEGDFIAAIRGLKAISGVEKFEVACQVSQKSEFTFGVSMEFKDQAAYEVAAVQPDHLARVTSRWIPEVAAFTQIDTLAL